MVKFLKVFLTSYFNLTCQDMMLNVCLIILLCLCLCKESL